MKLTNKGQSAVPTILAVVGVIILGALVWWAFTNLGTAPQEADNNGTIQDGEPLPVPADWETYSNNELGFSIKHPPQVTVRQEGEGRVQFALIGPDNTAGSELTDGFTMTVANENYSAYNSLQAYVNAQYQESLQINDGVQGPQPTTFNDREAYAYVVAGSFGEVEHMYIAHSADTTLHVSWSVQDPNEQGYALVIDIMRQTLSLSPTDEVALFTRVHLAVLDTTPDGEPDRGCDDVAFIERDAISPTTQPLNAALTRLFMLEDEQVDGYMNFIARTNNTLSFERATVENGTANIYLSGSLSGLAGVCDDPRAKIQIEETALRFSTVNNVRIFLNGEETDLQPSGQGE